MTDINQLQEHLTTLKLNEISTILEQQIRSKSHDSISFLERFFGLVEAQVIANENKRIVREQKNAGLRWSGAMMADINYKIQKSLNKDEIEGLSKLLWIEDKLNLFIVGSTGSGKTYLACALANLAILSGYKIMYTKYSDLLLKLKAAEKDEKLESFIKRCMRMQLIVIDELKPIKLADTERRLLFDFVEVMDHGVSLIVISQYSIDCWHEALLGAEEADSIIDRFINNAHTLEVNEKDSLRKAYQAKPRLQ